MKVDCTVAFCERVDSDIGETERMEQVKQGGMINKVSSDGFVKKYLRDQVVALYDEMSGERDDQFLKEIFA